MFLNTSLIHGDTCALVIHCITICKGFLDTVVSMKFEYFFYYFNMAM